MAQQMCGGNITRIEDGKLKNVLDEDDHIFLFVCYIIIKKNIILFLQQQQKTNKKAEKLLHDHPPQKKPN